MGWLMVMLVLTHQQGGAPSRPPPPPDPTMQMWVGLGMGFAVAMLLAPFVWRNTQRVVDGLMEQWMSPNRDAGERE